MELTARVGWIGCGRMGSAMATRLITAGVSVTAYNRTRSKAEALGVEVVDRPVDLAGQDIVFVMVSASDDLLQVVSGPEGVLGDPERAPRILVDCSTVASETSAEVRQLAEARGTAFLAAPISGNPKVVASGNSVQAVSGPREAYDEVAPYFGAIAKSAVYTGEGEVARLVKICHNMMLGIVTQAMAEITVLAEKGGVARHAWLEFLNDSVMGSPFTRYKSPAFVNLDFTPTFTPTLLRKDFDLGMAVAYEHDVSMPVSALTLELVKATIGAGYDGDFAVLLLESARAAGLTLQPENVTVDDGLGGR
ncbi:MAG: NAD(P)-dependent oxidoreductase [Acidobacteria bacterium]|nr:NAD(P)-dependent oxidoreductase [Acidobacteriota bacterium]